MRSRRSNVPAAGATGSAPGSMALSALSSCARCASGTGGPALRCERSRASSSRSLESLTAPPRSLGALAARPEGAAGCGRAAAARSADECLPGVLAPETLALLGEFHALGRQRDRVELAIHLDLALQLFVELGSHCVPYFTRPSDLRASSVCGRAPTRSCRRLSCGQRPMSTPTCAPQPSTVKMYASATVYCSPMR